MMKSVLLNVDDHEPGRYARSRLLIQAGYEVIDAGTGTEALALSESLRPALILLDVNLPDIDGLEVCRRIKANLHTSRTPILQVSASAISAPQRVSGLDNGADGYLVEPVDTAVLLATIRSLLRMRQAEEELHRANLALAESNSALAVANEALRRSNDDLQKFSYLASHDLQEPLRTLSTFSALLFRRYQGKLDADADMFLGHIQNGAHRMSALIRDLLSYAQIGYGDEQPLEPVDLNLVVHWAEGNLELSLRESGATILYDNLPRVKGDRTQLGQLFQNVIGNAIKYRKPDEAPVIRIEAVRDARDCWTVSVKDNGIGIALPHQADVFEPFKRLHGKEVPGSGIGLATCRRIVERHGGRIWVESEGRDRGSTFSFTLHTADAATAVV